MNEKKGKILWADDEIDLLRPHIMFLEEKGYDVKSVTNGEDAVEMSKTEKFDIVLLDEMMPGKDGLQTLTEIKVFNPALPVIMITKNEEESLMEDAIGSKITDYLTKPVNPSQILLAIKKILQTKEIETAKLSRDYTSEFLKISQLLNMNPDYNEWIHIYTKLAEKCVELDKYPDLGLEQSLNDQIKECNVEFSKFIDRNYRNWINSNKRPPLSVDIVSRYLIPELENNRNVFFIIIDCLRLDQWMAIELLLYEYFDIKRDYYYSILPSATPYSRNSIFSGLFPREIERQFPHIWKSSEADESSRNRNEKLFLDKHLARRGLKFKAEPKYFKILENNEAEKINNNLNNYLNIPLVSLVFNFVDNLAHKRSESEILKEIVPDESAFRSLTTSWFIHSPLYNILKKISRTKSIVILTTDHGSIRVSKPARIAGDRDTSKNLRYKFGRNLKCDSKSSLFIKNPESFKLPVVGVHCNYVIAKDENFLTYPTNYHKFVNLYMNSFQHGGISMEEMILPIVRLEGKG